jgi:hypothetical protein
METTFMGLHSNIEAGDSQQRASGSLAPRTNCRIGLGEPGRVSGQQGERWEQIPGIMQQIPGSKFQRPEPGQSQVKRKKGKGKSIWLFFRELRKPSLFLC